jgi:hypothetical protein
MWEQASGTNLWRVNRKTQRISFNLEIMFYGFPREKIHIWASSRKDGLVHLGYNIVYPIILFFLFLLTTLNQIKYWSILTSWNHTNMWIKLWRAFKVQRIRKL